MNANRHTTPAGPIQGGARERHWNFRNRDRETLLAALEEIDRSGWDSLTGRQLLEYVRAEIVRPHVVASGVRGSAADQAEATGWAAAWEMLASAALRTASSPWGLIWVAARRAVLGEIVTATYGASRSTSWRLHAADRNADSDAAQHDGGRSGGGVPACRGLLSLTALQEAGWEPAEPGIDAAHGHGGGLLAAVVEALTAVGWDRTEASLVVDGIARSAIRDGKASSEASGWRILAARWELPPWRVRRVTVLMLGAPGWPGLVERLYRDGPLVVQGADVQAALAATVRPHARSTAKAAQRASAGMDLAS